MLLHGTPALRTRRLLLRRYKPSDAQAAFSLWRQGVWDEDVSGFPAHRDVADTAALIARWIDSYQSPNVLRWAIEQDGRWIGDAAVTVWQPLHDSCELGFCLAQSARGQGLMEEALREIIRYLLLDAGFHRAALKIRGDNPACLRLARRMGLAHEGTLRDAVKAQDGTYRDLWLFAAVAQA